MTEVNMQLRSYFEENYARFAGAANNRAIPSARDGLKTVHRRILFTLKHMAPAIGKEKKAAKAVGEIMATVHPHGDSSIYDALVRLAQPFQMMIPLVKGVGNFGAVDGSSAAAYRYTECKLHPYAEKIYFKSIDENSVDFIPNYDQTSEEPKFLPARLPMILINGAPDGSMGVGFKSTIPTHNPGEVIELVKYVIQQIADQKAVDTDEMFAILPGPDFPTGGQIVLDNYERMKELYNTGASTLKIRSTYTVTPGWVTFNSVPYGVTTQKILESLNTAMHGSVGKDGKKKGPVEILDASITEIIDASNEKEGVKILVKLMSGVSAPPELLEALFKHSELETSYGYQFTCLDSEGSLKQYSLTDIIQEWLEFRVSSIKRCAMHQIEVLKEREHIIMGLLICFPRIEEVIKIIRAAASEEEAILVLVESLKITKKQAHAISNMRIGKLNKLDVDALANEARSVRSSVKERFELLQDTQNILSKIYDEVETLNTEIVIPRKTEIVIAGAPIKALSKQKKNTLTKIPSKRSKGTLAV